MKPARTRHPQVKPLLSDEHFSVVLVAGLLEDLVAHKYRHFGPGLPVRHRDVAT
jgi:hypothetical protein